MNSHYSAAALRKNVIAFLSGKVFSAILTFLLMMLLVRALPLQTYGVYIALLAVMDLMLGVCDIGMHGLGARYIPEFVLRASKKMTASLVRKQVAIYSLSVLCGASLFFLMFPYVGGWLGIEDLKGTVEYFLLVIVIEGVSRLLRDQTMSVLMRQDIARTALLIKLSLMLLLTVFLWVSAELTLFALIMVEVSASLLALVYLVVKLAGELGRPAQGEQAPDWQPPNFFKMWRSGLNMYVSSLVSLAYSTAMFVVLLQRMAGPEIVALFGFAKNLIELVLRYLPVNLLYGVIQPHIVAVQLQQGAGKLAELVRFARKLNYFVLLPIFSCIVLYGGWVLSLASGARFEDRWVLAGMLLVLFPLSSRRLLETAALVLDKSHYCVQSSFAGLLGLPVFLMMASAGMGVWSAITGTLVSQFAYNLWIEARVARLARFSLDVKSFFRLLLPVVVSFGFLILIPQEASYVAVGLTFFLVLCFFLACWHLFKPFDDGERRLINGFVGRRIFVW